MELVVVSPDRVAETGARWVLAALSAAGRPDATLMPALGATALPIYAALAAARARGALDTTRLRLIQLDEYAGLAADDPRTLIGWLRRDVARPLGIPDERIVRLSGEAACDADGAGAGGAADATGAGAGGVAQAVHAYDAAVAAAGGVDVAVLGLGPNGHLGFNEPPSGPDAPTRWVALTPASLASNARYWPELGSPRAALTAGMTTILAARRILLVVTGAGKRAILRATLLGDLTPDVPATFLRTHPALTVLTDSDAWPDGSAT